MRWRRTRDRLLEVLDARFAKDDIARLCAEGAAMREEDAVRLALGDEA